MARRSLVQDEVRQRGPVAPAKDLNTEFTEASQRPQRRKPRMRRLALRLLRDLCEDLRELCVEIFLCAPRRVSRLVLQSRARRREPERLHVSWTLGLTFMRHEMGTLFPFPAGRFVGPTPRGSAFWPGQAPALHRVSRGYQG